MSERMVEETERLLEAAERLDPEYAERLDAEHAERFDTDRSDRPVRSDLRTIEPSPPLDDLGLSRDSNLIHK
jgi:hypothetical protein